MKTGLGIVTPIYCNDGAGNFLFHKRSERCSSEHDTWDMGGARFGSFASLETHVLQEVFVEYRCHGVIQERLPTHDCLLEYDDTTSLCILIPFFIQVNRRELEAAKENRSKKISAIGWFRIEQPPQPLYSGSQYSLTHFQGYFKKYASLQKSGVHSISHPLY